MKFLPSQEISLHSPLAAREAARRLATAIEFTRGFHFLGRTVYKKAYEGQVDRGLFRIKSQRVMSGQWRPLISGNIIDEKGGCRIELKMALDSGTKSLSYIIFGLGSLAAVFSNIVALYFHSFDLEIFSAVIIFALGYFLMRLSFKTECERALKELSMIFAIKAREPFQN